MFFNELDLLEWRMKICNDYVDHFVIVESERTISNIPKPNYFKENEYLFSNYKDKIIYVSVPGAAFTNNHWMNEQIQRNAIMNGLADCRDDDLICVTDIDEIPNYRNIPQQLNGIVFLEMYLFYYFVNYRVMDNKRQPCLWDQKAFVSNMLNLRNLNLNGIRNSGGSSIIKDAGWHFSYLFGEAWHKYKEKICSFSHSEFNLPEYTDIDRIKARIQRGIDLFDRNEFTFSKENFDVFFPSPVKGLKQAFAERGLILH